MPTNQNDNKFIILEASAGSGKTHNLAKRYINLLLNYDSAVSSVPLKNILALTFANKATIEMKERIMDYLKKIALKQDVKDLLSDSSLSKEQLSNNAKEAVNSIIDDFDHFNVRTIDSFINLIIKACALKLGISPSYKILDSYENYIDYSIDSFLDKSFVNPQIKDTLDTFFKQYLIDNTASWYVRGNIATNFKKLYKKEISKKLRFIDDDVDYSAQISKLIEDFKSVCKEINKIENFEQLIPINIKLRNYNTNIINGTKKLFKDTICVFYTKEEMPYDKKISQDMHNENLENLRIKGKNILSDIVEFKAKRYFNNYIKMFESILYEFDVKSKKDSVIFLQDLNKQVTKIFQQEGLPPEIYLSLSNKFTDFLIDEFQDTNKTQWQTLKLLIEDNLANGGSFFYVGDKKQAIYGFRGGDSKIFDIPKTEFQGYNQKILDTNYRSCQAIIDFNNNVFSKNNVQTLLQYIASDKKNNLTDIEQYTKNIIETFSSSKQQCCKEKENLGYVDIQYQEYQDTITQRDEQIKQYLYKTIDELKKRFSNKDITIICRKNKEIEKVGKWLLERNINIESFQTLNIANSSIIKELICTLQFFNLPINNISFAGFITSEIFLKATGLQKEEILNFLTNISLETKHKVAFYTLFKQQYSDIWEKYIEELFDSAGFVAVYEMVISILSKYKVLENFKDYNNVILRFLEVVSDFEKDKQGLNNFINYFNDFKKNEKNEKFFIKMSSSDAITVITSHKSKGLQFNVVVMPFFSLNPTDGTSETIFSVENEDSVSFLNIKKDYTGYSQYLKDIYFTHYFKKVSDELNALYVSTTRAIYEFHALIIQKEKKKSTDRLSLINYFIGETYRHFGSPQKYKQLSVVKDKEQQVHLEIDTTPFNNVIELINDSSIEVYGKRNNDILLKGKIIHYALSHILTFDDTNKDTVINNAINEVAILYPDQEIDWLQPMLLELLSNKDIVQFFNKSNNVFNEKEFVDSNGNTIRIDKLVITDKEVSIIDFKSSIYDKEYIKEQMDRYKNVVEQIYPTKKVNCYIVDIGNNKLVY